MHISEGVLSAPVLVAGAAFTLGATAWGLKKTDYENIPAMAMLCGIFFIASLIHVPIGVSSAHLILNGLLGIVLGWGAFPVILIALVLQAVFFGFGGVTTLGVNVLIMALPAVLAYYTFGGFLKSRYAVGIFLSGVAVGMFGIGCSALLAAAALILSDSGFEVAGKIIPIVHVPVMLAEGIITGAIVVFLKKVKPGLLHFYRSR